MQRNGSFRLLEDIYAHKHDMALHSCFLIYSNWSNEPSWKCFCFNVFPEVKVTLFIYLNFSFC